MLDPMNRETAKTGIRREARRSRRCDVGRRAHEAARAPLTAGLASYSHLAHDSRQDAVSLLDALAFERGVDAPWTSSLHPETAHRAGFAS
jgi:hypothetical protein